MQDSILSWYGSSGHSLHTCLSIVCVDQVPRIAELRETVTGIKNELVEQTSQAFNQVGQLASSTADPEGFQREADKPGQFRSLQEACLVVDALGGQARQHQVPIFWGSDISRLRMARFRSRLRGHVGAIPGFQAMRSHFHAASVLSNNDSGALQQRLSWRINPNPRCNHVTSRRCSSHSPK